MNVHGYPIHRCGIPIILMIPKVRVRIPNRPEELTEIDNPLYSCQFPDGTNKWDDVGPLKWADRNYLVSKSCNLASHSRIFNPNRCIRPKGCMTNFLCILFAEFRQPEIMTIASSIKLSTTRSVTAPVVSCFLVEKCTECFWDLR